MEIKYHFFFKKLIFRTHLKSINSNPAFAFLKDEEDIYTLNDGKAVELKN